MPSKKKKGGKSTAERQRAMAIRAEKKLPLEALPPFPGPETSEQEIGRLLGYKYLSPQFQYGNPISIARKGDGFEVKEFSNDMQLEKTYDIQVLSDEIKRMVPDYDRNTADYPVASEVISTRGAVDMARRVKRRIKDVPPEKLDVFLKFIEAGEGVEIKCDILERGLLGRLFSSSTEYNITVKLAGEDEAFAFTAGTGEVGSTSFIGSFGICLDEKCQKDLAEHLMFESMRQISGGTAKLAEGISPDKILWAIASVLRRFFTDRKKWKDLIGVSAFLLDHRVATKASMNMTTSIEGELGEALEGCGFFSHAALVYAEAGKHLYEAAHPKAATVLRNAGIAWKRHGDYEQAESFYVLALHSLRFQPNHVDYRQEVFGILRSIFIIYYDPAKNIAPLKLLTTLRALFYAAGEKLGEPGDWKTDGTPVLREPLHSASKEQICRVFQWIVGKATSVVEIRDAILSCRNSGVRHVELTKLPGERDRKEHARGFLEDSRGYLQQHYKSIEILATCSACGEVKGEKSFATCSACKRENYCDTKCQAEHWPEHKEECKSNRKKKAATKPASKGNRKKN